MLWMYLAGVLAVLDRIYQVPRVWSILVTVVLSVYSFALFFWFAWTASPWWLIGWVFFLIWLPQVLENPVNRWANGHGTERA